VSDTGAPPPARLDVRKTLRPGERGTRKLLGIYGNDLVSARYSKKSSRKVVRGGTRDYACGECVTTPPSPSRFAGGF